MVRGLTERVTAAHVQAVYTDDNTQKTTAALGAMLVSARKKSGTSVGSMGSNANILVLRNNTTATHIFDAEGDSHQDVGTAWTNFDDHDDVGLLDTISAGLARAGDPLREQFGGLLEAHRESLEAARIVTFNEDGHHFVNWSRLNMLEVGAIRQLAGRVAKLETMLT